MDRGPGRRSARGAASLIVPGNLFTAVGLAGLVVPGPVVVLIGAAVFGVGFGMLQNVTLTQMYGRSRTPDYGVVSAVLEPRPTTAGWRSGVCSSRW